MRHYKTRLCNPLASVSATKVTKQTDWIIFDIWCQKLLFDASPNSAQYKLYIPTISNILFQIMAKASCDTNWANCGSHQLRLCPTLGAGMALLRWSATKHGKVASTRDLTIQLVINQSRYFWASHHSVPPSGECHGVFAWVEACSSWNLECRSSNSTCAAAPGWGPPHRGSTNGNCSAAPPMDVKIGSIWTHLSSKWHLAPRNPWWGWFRLIFNWYLYIRLWPTTIFGNSWFYNVMWIQTISGLLWSFGILQLITFWHFARWFIYSWISHSPKFKQWFRTHRWCPNHRLHSNGSRNKTQEIQTLNQKHISVWPDDSWLMTKQKIYKKPHQMDKNGLEAPILETAMSYFVTSFTIKPCSRSSSPPVSKPHLQGLSLGFRLLPSALSFVDGIDETWSKPNAMRRGQSLMASLELHGVPFDWVTIPKWSHQHGPNSSRVKLLPLLIDYRTIFVPSRLASTSEVDSLSNKWHSLDFKEMRFASSRIWCTTQSDAGHSTGACSQYPTLTLPSIRLQHEVLRCQHKTQVLFQKNTLLHNRTSNRLNKSNDKQLV